MVFEVIDNPDFHKFKAGAGFRNSQFKKLAGLFSRGASAKVLFDMSVDVDFEAGVCTVIYYQSSSYQPFMQFMIKQVGPRTTMYELWQEGKGRIAKSELFDRVFEKLCEHIEPLIAQSIP